MIAKYGIDRYTGVAPSAHLAPVRAAPAAPDVTAAGRR
jgi:hypothetical protein